MLSYEFFTLQNRFTNRIYRSEVRTVQRPQETDCRASLFFQLSTVEVKLQLGLFH